MTRSPQDQRHNLFHRCHHLFHQIRGTTCISWIRMTLWQISDTWLPETYDSKFQMRHSKKRKETLQKLSWILKLKFQLVQTITISKMSVFHFLRWITKLQKLLSPMLKKRDLVFLKTLFQVYLTTMPWQFPWVAFRCKKTLLVLNLEALGIKIIVMCTQIILILFSPISLCNLICKFHHKEYMALEKDPANSVLSKEHGQCGPTAGKSLTMTDQPEANRHMACILLLWSSLKKRLSGWESSSEMPMHNLQWLPTKPTTLRPWLILQLVDNLKCTSSPKVTQSKLLKPIKTWLASLNFHHSGPWAGT